MFVMNRLDESERGRDTTVTYVGCRGGCVLERPSKYGIVSLRLQRKLVWLGLLPPPTPDRGGSEAKWHLYEHQINRNNYSRRPWSGAKKESGCTHLRWY